MIDFAELALRARREEKERAAAIAVAVSLAEGRDVVIVAASEERAKETMERVRRLLGGSCGVRF